MSATEKYTVIGAGHGGKAMAAHLAIMGADVALWNRTFDHISVIKKRGGIELESAEGGPHGFGKLSLVTSDTLTSPKPQLRISSVGRSSSCIPGAHSERSSS
jgi:ketopantoate reductase